SASDHHTFVETRPRLGHGRRRKIHVDVICNEEIKFAIAVIVNKRAAGVPALAIACYAGLCAYVAERSVSVIVIKDILTEISNVQVVPAVVVVVANAATLAPSGVGDAGLQRHIGEGSIAIVLEEMRCRLAAGGKSLQTRPVNEKDVEPAVVI